MRWLSKILFTPFSVASGALAGLLGRRLFQGLWSVIDKQDPPHPGDRDAPWSKVVLALLLEGAIFRAVRGIVDRAARHGFSKLTGSWPGDERPDAG